MAKMTAGPLGGELSGRVGNAVFVRTANGTVVRDLVIPHDPQTPAQRAFRQRQSLAARAWSNLDPSAAALWAAYAKGVGMRPMNAFTTLYGRLLRLSPAAPVPLAPSALPFFGDVVSASTAGTTTGVTFASTGPNAPGVVTELLLQPLASRNRRAYRDKYRTQAFVAFPSASSRAVPFPPGWVACAYRFVSASTGQATEIAELGVVKVG